MSLQHTQIDRQVLHKLGKVKERPVTPTRAETRQEDLQPGEETHGVVAIREQVSGPAIIQLTFGTEGRRKVQATAVF
jgi:hypothetical protein